MSLVIRVGILDIFGVSIKTLYVRDDKDYSIVDDAAPIFLRKIQFNLASQ